MTSWSPDAKFYQGGQWRLFAAGYLSNHPTCCVPGCGSKATHVDHIVPIRAGGRGYDFDNLQPLCFAHHNQKTAIFDRPTRKTKKTRLTVRGCDVDGRPNDPLAPYGWGRK